MDISVSSVSGPGDYDYELVLFFVLQDDAFNFGYRRYLDGTWLATAEPTSQIFWVSQKDLEDAYQEYKNKPKKKVYCINCKYYDLISVSCSHPSVCVYEHVEESPIQKAHSEFVSSGDCYEANENNDCKYFEDKIPLTRTNEG